VLGGVCFLIAIPFTLRVQETVAQPPVQSSFKPALESEPVTK